MPENFVINKNIFSWQQPLNDGCCLHRMFLKQYLKHCSFLPLFNHIVWSRNSEHIGKIHITICWVIVLLEGVENSKLCERPAQNDRLIAVSSLTTDMCQIAFFTFSLFLSRLNVSNMNWSLLWNNLDNIYWTHLYSLELDGDGLRLWRIWRDCKTKAQAVSIRVNDEGMKAGSATVEEMNYDLDWNRKGKIKK